MSKTEIQRYYKNLQDRTMVGNCNFCNDIFKKNREQELPEKEALVYEDENIFVMPDIAPLTVGHLLIISKKHYQGYGNADLETLSSVKTFLKYYKHKIGGRSFTIFEHGATIAYHAGASIDHAHIHIVPFEIDMQRELEADFGKKIRCDLLGLKEFAAKKQCYLYFQSGCEQLGYAYLVGEIESQYLRKVANKFIRKTDEFNWKRIYKKEIAYLDFQKTLAWWKSLEYPVNYKWKKKLILEKYNLLKYKNLIEQTARFRIGEEITIRRMIEKEIHADKKKCCRVVLVPLRHQYKLPNCIICGKCDLGKLDHFFGQNEQYTEIWYHTNTMCNKKNKFSGRISFILSGFEMEEIVEIVAGDNPREIEAYTMYNKKLFFMRLHKQQRFSKYQIVNLEIDKRIYDDKEMEENIKNIVMLIENSSERILRLTKMISQYGIKSYSIDFTISDGEIIFIDWDTSDDERILKYEDC